MGNRLTKKSEEPRELGHAWEELRLECIVQSSDCDAPYTATIALQSFRHSRSAPKELPGGAHVNSDAEQLWDSGRHRFRAQDYVVRSQFLGCGLGSEDVDAVIRLGKALS